MILSSALYPMLSILCTVYPPRRFLIVELYPMIFNICTLSNDFYPLHYVYPTIFWTLLSVCRYGVFDFEYTHQCQGTSEASKKEKLFLMSWCPDSAKIKKKMLYSSSFDALKKCLVGVQKFIQVCFHHTLQRHNVEENSKQIFPEKELRGHSPNSHIHVSVSDWYIPTIDLPILLQENMWTDPWNI